MEQYITWTGTTQCPTVQTHTPHRMQEDPSFNEPVAKDSSYPWLVDSYDTHKGKRWLNSNPQTTGPDIITQFKVFLVLYTEHTPTFLVLGNVRSKQCATFQ